MSPRNNASSTLTRPMIAQVYNHIPGVVSLGEVDRLLSLRVPAYVHHDEEGHVTTALEIPFLTGMLNRRLAGTFGLCFKRFDFSQGNGGVPLHIDKDVGGFTRSILIFLGTDYQGGLTWFDDAGRSVHSEHPNAGDAILFDHQTMHWADPVSEGHKIVMKGDWR